PSVNKFFERRVIHQMDARRRGDLWPRGYFGLGHGGHSEDNPKTKPSKTQKNTATLAGSPTPLDATTGTVPK
ncbi:MAG: hypothetical protein WA230_10905, partial [Xanthobacteraceae bacterium]